MTGKKLRCAIYTRKSSEEGLEQGFNSLHAQREACEAYVLSQAGEGWKALATEYDDGGFSGGSMERPGLQRLLTDIGRGMIDVVVVYKVDRLTRSLTDFAKIVEAFDRDRVSFVSVTQAFNTTTSMGRLTLNVLLSFAQFEREVTGERIRDKIAASKKKGMWMGGVPPLGYDLPTDQLTRALVVNELQAETVRLMFAKYLDLGSVRALQAWLGQNQIRSKAWVTAKGRQAGGLAFERGALFHLLSNRVYVGEITHKGACHPGAHPPIVDQHLFDEVQVKLASQTRRHHDRPKRVSTMVLKGLLFDTDGEAMSPTFTHGARGKVYRYYVSSNLQRGTLLDPGDEAIRRVPAGVIESLVTGCVATLGASQTQSLGEALARVEVHPTTVQLTLRRNTFFKRRGDPASEVETLSRRLGPGERIEAVTEDSTLVRVTLPCRMKFNRGRICIEHAKGALGAGKAHPDPSLIRALQAGHRYLAENSGVSVGRPESLPLSRAPESPYHRNLCRLAFLAPDIQAAILEGRQGSGITLTGLLTTNLPTSWKDQRRLFAIPC